jgi:ABC-2 type transport system ATP-binding protein
VWPGVAITRSVGFIHALRTSAGSHERLAVIDHGRKIAEDTPAGLKRRMGADRVEVVASESADLPEIRGIVESVADGEATVDEVKLAVSAAVGEPVTALTSAVTAIRDKQIDIADIGLRRPTLDEAFLELIGTNETREDAR